jgi:predicted hydrocarbon binding protein
MAEITVQQTEKLLKGSQTFSYLSFSMLLMRMKMLYAGDSSNATLQRCAEEIGAFLEKFKSNMSADILTLQKL